MIKRKKKYRFSMKKYYWYWGDISSRDLPDLEILQDYFSFDSVTKSLFRLRDYNHKKFVEPRVIKGKIYALYDMNQVGKVLKVEDIIEALTNEKVLEEFEARKAAEKRLLKKRIAISEKKKRKERHKLVKY